MGSKFIDEIVIDKLKLIADEVREKHGKLFPYQCCGVASGMIENRLGFKQKTGLCEDKDGKWSNHCWNITKDEYIVDLTIRQFKPDLPEIHIVKKEEDYTKTGYAENVYFMI